MVIIFLLFDSNKKDIQMQQEFQKWGCPDHLWDDEAGESAE